MTPESLSLRSPELELVFEPGQGASGDLYLTDGRDGSGCGAIRSRW